MISEQNIAPETEGLKPVRTEVVKDQKDKERVEAELTEEGFQQTEFGYASKRDDLMLQVRAMDKAIDQARNECKECVVVIERYDLFGTGRLWIKTDSN